MKDHPSSIGHRILRGAFVIIFFGIFLKLGGMLMYWLLNHYYKTGPVLDAFTAIYGKVIILLFYSSFLKVMVPAFMPLFAEQRHKEGEEGAWQFVNTMVNMALAGSVLAAAGAMIFTPWMVDVLFPKFKPETHDLAVSILRWMAPGMIIQFFAIASLGLLNSYKIFSFPSAGEATQKLVWAGGIFAMVSVLKVPALAANAPAVIGASYLVGCVAQACVLLYGIGRERLKLYKPTFPLVSVRRLGIEVGWLALCAALFAGWALLLRWIAAEPGRAPWGIQIDAGDLSFFTITGLVAAGCLYCAILWLRGRRGTTLMARVAMLCAPLILGALFARYRDLVLASFQSFTEEGQFSIIELASKVASLPSVLVAYSLSIAMFPYLSDMAARKDTSHHGAVVGGSVRMLAVVLLPLTGVLIVLSEPVMRLLFDTGSWQADKIYSAQFALAVISTGIFFMAIENVLMQAFFSLQQMMLPTVLGIVISVGSSLTLYVLIGRLGFEAQAFLIACIAYPAPRIIKNLLLLWFVNRRAPLMAPGTAWFYVGRLAVVSLGATAAAWAGLIATRGFVQDYPLDLAAHLGQGKLAVKVAKALPAFKLSMAAEVIVPMVLAVIAYAILMVVLRMEELRLVIDYVRQRGWKAKKAPAATANGEA